ncbi:phosphocholine cytidylyltransferase family protein [Agrobacterium fabrum]|uniref:phosphocholine cytidylyltransferase family protein n=1 Tax=Agrobacterium fabrum TaxID=1176649 RepID=UPI003B9F89AD
MKRNAPKKAIILAAGFGSRLRPLTDLRPKPLVEVNGISILENALRNLEAIGVEDVTIVVGYRKDAIQYRCGNRFGTIAINYVESTVFDKTGSAYSLWLARSELMSDDLLLLEGDVFFELEALRTVVDVDAGNAAALAAFDVTMEGSAAILSGNGDIAEIRLKQTAADLTKRPLRLFKTMNLYRFRGEDLRGLIVPHLEYLVSSGGVKSYTEEVLSYLVRSKGLRIAGAICDGLRWYEIDNEDDLRKAELIFSPQQRAVVV